MTRAESFEFGRQAARWDIAKGRVTEAPELAGRVRVGHLTEWFAAGYTVEVQTAEALGAEIRHIPEVVA